MFVLDELTQLNSSKFALFLKVENLLCILGYTMFVFMDFRIKKYSPNFETFH